MGDHRFGRLEPVDLRAGWTREDRDFTPWLAEEPNIQYLGEVLGLELEVVQTEENVGPFRADIVCRDVLTDTTVLIENQLERTDHAHLGQLITYAAGLEAVHIIWIARSFTEEHRAALDWLNRVTDDSCQAFGLEIQLWRIGDSPIAPRLNIVARPNEWSKQAAAAKRSSMGSRSERGAEFHALWTDVAEHFSARKATFPIPTPRGMNWVHVPLHPQLRLILSCGLDRRRAKVYFFRSKDAPLWFGTIHEQRATLDARFAEMPQWNVREEGDGHGLWVCESNDEGEEAQTAVFDWLFARVVDVQDHLLPALVEVLEGG